MTLGERLKMLREEKGISRRQVSLAIGLEQSTYGKFESEQKAPGRDIVQKLADFYNVTTDYLLGRTEERRTDEISALHITGGLSYEDLPPEAIQELEHYKQYLIQKYGKKKSD